MPRKIVRSFFSMALGARMIPPRNPECTGLKSAFNDFVRQRAKRDVKHASVLRFCCAASEGNAL